LKHRNVGRKTFAKSSVYVKFVIQSYAYMHCTSQQGVLGLPHMICAYHKLNILIRKDVQSFCELHKRALTFSGHAQDCDVRISNVPGPGLQTLAD
jgi:hypothetical protein